MCYANFDDILGAVADLDADVISLEASRSGGILLDAFKKSHYPNDVGPGVYDIHSPRVPTVDGIEALLGKTLESVSPEQLWVNPDCGLKTRQWAEVRPALTHMVEAARRLRQRLAVAK
jgi:5-methyltetrahydropteroyltriglutamate--homocysteine methyltransferase